MKSKLFNFEIQMKRRYLYKFYLKAKPNKDLFKIKKFNKNEQHS